jgi:hypothetical protein
MAPLMVTSLETEEEDEEDEEEEVCCCRCCCWDCVGTEEEEVEDEVSSSELELLPNICIKELNILNFCFVVLV